MSMVTDIADAVAAELNGAEPGTFSEDFTAERLVLPEFDLEDLAGLKVTVVPKSVQIAGSTRSVCQYDVAIDIGVQKKLGTDLDAEVAAMGTLVDEISDFLRRRPLAAMPSTVWVGASVGKIGRQLTGISAVVLAPLAGAAKVFANMGDSLQKMAARTGITVESLSELSFAAEQSGAGIETFGKAVGSMQRSIRDAGRGLATKTESLKDLGLSYEALAALSPEDQFKTIAEAISLVPDATQRAAISMELFGRSGRQLMPMLKGGAAGIEALQRQARSLGLTISTQSANAAAALTDEMNILWKSLKRVTYAVGEALAPTIQAASEAIRDNMGAVMGWIQANKDAIVQTAKIVVGVAAVGTGLIAMGAAIGAVSTILGALVTVVRIAVVAMMNLGKAAIFLAKNPMVLLAAVVAAAIAQNIDWSKALRRLKASIMDLLPSFTKFGDVSYKTTEQLKAEQAEMEGKASRLAELRNKHRLTNAEMVEAEELSHALTTAYPKLASVIDGLGRSAQNTARAMDALKDAFAENLIREKVKELEAAKKWVQKLEAQARAAKEAGDSIAGLQARKGRVPVGEDVVTRAANRLTNAVFGTEWGQDAARTKIQGQIDAAKALAGQYDGIAAKIAYGTKNIAAMEAHVAKLKAAMKKPPKELGAPKVDLAEEAAKFNKVYAETVIPLWAKLKADWRARNAEMASLILDIEAIRAQGIAGALDRELELTRISYQRRIDAAREANKSIILIEQARAEELAQIRKRHADEAAQARRDHEQSIAEEIGRLKVETTQEGLAKALALLRLQERREIEAARKVGANVELVREKYRLRQALAEKSATAREGKAKAQEVEPGGSVVGTFSGYALGLFGSALKMDRLVAATEATARNTKDMNRKKGLAFV